MSSGDNGCSSKPKVKNLSLPWHVLPPFEHTMVSSLVILTFLLDNVVELYIVVI